MLLTLKEWHRKTFAVQLPGAGGGRPRAELAQGLISGPFGIYVGTPFRVGPPEVGAKSFTLIHLPSQIAKLTLPQQKLCRQAAEEFAACDLAWESAWPFDITGPKEELAKAQEIYRRWKSFGVRKSWGER